MSLHLDEFPMFFEELYGYRPFPWQERLLRTVANDRTWPRVLDLPTSAGKTATIDIAVFHLALETARGTRRAPVRIAFVVDRRLVVDDAYERAANLAARLAAAPPSSVTARVADALTQLSLDGLPLVVKRLRGGLPREKDWARTPGQPTILCSTVDQVGSRLLFRGYGVSDGMKSLHAGLIGSDCLILLDEAHLAEPFRQTLEWVNQYRGNQWSENSAPTPWASVLLTATPGAVATGFSLREDDWNHKILGPRLKARKSAILKLPGKRGGKEENGVTGTTLAQRVVQEVRAALDHCRANGVASPAIGIVMNRVQRARDVFALLLEEFRDEVREERIESPLLMIGPARSLDREDVARQLAPIRTTSSRETTQRLRKPLLIVATQCLEAGVDIDLDGLITELAPLDSLRQRFGRLNRAGRQIEPYGAILASKQDIHRNYVDRVYGRALKEAWDRLAESSEHGPNGPVVEFGVEDFSAVMTPESLAPRADAPVLLPAHLDLLSQTSPIPAADPEVALYLHGPERQPDSVTVIWRGDISHQENVDVRRLLLLVPPRSSEAVTLPVWTVKGWLNHARVTSQDLADVPMSALEERPRRTGGNATKVFRWSGDDERSGWIGADQLRPGDTIVVPSFYGGLDSYGWNPESRAVVVDRGDEANAPFAGRKFAVRVARGFGDGPDVAEVIAANLTSGWRALRDALVDVIHSDATRNALLKLNEARKGRVVIDTEVYGVDEKGRPQGVVFIAPLGLKMDAPLEASESSTEDDLCGSLSGFALSLDQHSIDTEQMADRLGRAAGLDGNLLTDVKLAAFLHDAGKADPRFQSWMHWGDPLGADPESVLAKSSRPLPRASRMATGLPHRWRHEALSVRLALVHERFSEAADPALVLWLVGTHHGYGRPLYPHADPTETAPDVGPQNLGFSWQGSDWPTLFANLKKRYGVWELARLEAIVRLADHRASEMRAKEASA